MFSLQALLKKHEAFMADLEAYRSVIEDLREQAQACKVREPNFVTFFSLKIMKNRQ